MSSKSLFGSFKYCLKSLLILGLFPWKFDGDKQTLRALDWKIHMTIVFANYVIWSLPYDIHYFPFVVKEFSGNMPNSEILLFLFIIRRVNSFVFYVTLPIAHHITCMSLRQKFCHFYETNQKRLNLYNITWTINKLRFWIVVCILLVSFLVLLYCDANSSLAIVLNETEVVAFPIVFSVIKEIQCLLIMAIIVGIILEISSALFSWIKTLKGKMENAQIEELVNQTLHECMELIQACEELKTLFSGYLKWMVLVGLIVITYSLLNLCLILVTFFMGNSTNDITTTGYNSDTDDIYVMGMVSFLAIGMIYSFGIFINSSTIKNGLKQLQLILKKTYFPRLMKTKWKGKEVPASFVAQQIIDEIERFQGLISIGSSSVMIWFFTFFLFFLQFGIESPSEEQPNASNVTCCCNFTQ